MTDKAEALTRIIYKNRWGVECEVDASEIVSVEGFAGPQDDAARINAEAIAKRQRDLARRAKPGAAELGLREAVARLVQPRTWELRDAGAFEHLSEHHAMIAQSLATADEILALICPAESSGSGGEAVGPSPGPVTPSELKAQLSNAEAQMKGMREALSAFSIYRVEDDIGALHLSAGGKRAWVSIGSKAAEVLLQVDAIQRAALQPQEGKE